MTWKPPFPVVKLPDCQQNWDAIAKEVDDIRADLAADLATDGWINFSGVGGDGGFFNSSVNLDTGTTSPGASTQRNCAYKLFADGTVRLRGVLKAGVNGAIALQLPATCRPPISDQDFISYASGGFGAVDVNSAGAVIPASITGSVTTWVYLDTVCFDTNP